MSLCVYTCVSVCDVSHGTRLTQHHLASHNIPFGLSVPGLSPCPAAQLQVRRIGSWGKAGDPFWFEKRGPILDPTSQITPSPPCSYLVQCYSYREGGRGRESKQAGKHSPERAVVLPPSTATSSVQRANQ